jgi:hypothetical protein
VQLICSFAKASVAHKVIAVARTIFEKAFILTSLRKKFLGVGYNPNPSNYSSHK